MRDKAAEISELLAPVVMSLGLELLGVEFASAADGALLRLYIDVPLAERDVRSVTIDDCETVSHEVSAQLDVSDPIKGHYVLEVSSPGIERPLFTAAQFERHLGERAKITLQLPQDGRRRLQGTIVAVESAVIKLAVDGEEVGIVFDTIEKARLVPDWEALGLIPNKSKPGRKRRGAMSSGNQQTNKPAVRSNEPNVE